MQKGYNVFFKNDVCTILDRPPSRHLIVKVQMKNIRMFPLKISSDLKEEGVQAQLSMNSQEDKRKVVVVTQVNFQAEVKGENWLWHLRFSHLHFGGLNLLHRKCMVKGLPLVEKPNNLCEGCILGKQHREIFLIGNLVREKALLEIVHSDLCGPMQTPSIVGSDYLLIFIDDYTRKTRLLFRSKVDTTSKSLGLTEVVNTFEMTSFNFVGSMEFTRNLQQDIHLNKMVWQKGRIGPLWKWKGVC